VREWKAYMTTPMLRSELGETFGRAHGVGVIGGVVSGNLEVLDFDKPGVVKAWFERLTAADERLAAIIRNQAVAVMTPSGGAHVYYRSSSPVAGSAKLAMAAEDYADNLGKLKRTIIETKAEGGYVVAPPTPGYKLVKNTFEGLPLLRGSQVRTLHEVAASFDETEASLPPVPAQTGADRPGDAYNADDSEQTSDLLVKHGWTKIRHTGGAWQMCRPGKTGGISATADFDGGGVYVFSSNAVPFTESRNYSKFEAFCLLEHSGNRTSAASELGRRYKHVLQQPNLPPQGALAAARRPGHGLSSKIQSGATDGLLGAPENVRCLLRTKLIEYDGTVIEPHGFIERGKTAMLVGEGGAGKTYFSMQMAVAVASGRSFLRYDVAEQGRVLLLSAEMNSSDMDRRMFACLNSAGILGKEERIATLANIDRVPLHGEPAGLISQDGRPPELLNAIVDQVNSKKYALVVFDPLASFGGTKVELNQDNATRDFVTLMNSLASSEGKPTVMLIHHTNKAARGGVQTSSGAARGTSALTDGVRWQGNLENREPIHGLPEVVVFRTTKANETQKPFVLWLEREPGAGTLKIASKQTVEAYRNNEKR